MLIVVWNDLIALPPLYTFVLEPFFFSLFSIWVFYRKGLENCFGSSTYEERNQISSFIIK